MKTPLMSNNRASNVEVSDENAANCLLNERCHRDRSYFSLFLKYFCVEIAQPTNRLDFVTRASQVTKRILRVYFSYFVSVRFCCKDKSVHRFFAASFLFLKNVQLKCFPESAESLPNKEPRTSRHLNK